jgi:hypothetical protein
VPLLLTVAVGGQSGCAILMFPMKPDPSTQAVSEVPYSPPSIAMAPADLSKIEPGNYAQFYLPRMSSEHEGKPNLKWIGGRVIAIDAEDIVLTECVVPSNLSTTSPKTILERVPYYNRYFKKTGWGTYPTSIPGELRIPKSSIVLATPIPNSEWQSFLQPHFERIEFDYEVRPCY